jgi:hypothetical protein
LHPTTSGGPKPTLKPIGAPEFRQPTNAEKSAYLKSQKEQIQQDSFYFVDKEAAREKNPTTQRVLRDAVRNELYGNPYEGMSDEQMRTTRQQQGPINPEKSADYMEARRGRTPNSPPTIQGEPPQSAGSEKAVSVSPSYYAMQSLNYTRMTEKADTLPSKSSVETKLQDKQGPDKPLLPSEMASLSLNYTVITQQADSVSDPAPDKSPEPTKMTLTLILNGLGRYPCLAFYQERNLFDCCSHPLTKLDNVPVVAQAAIVAAPPESHCHAECPPQPCLTAPPNRGGAWQAYSLR